MPSWLDDAPYIGGEAREYIESLIDAESIPPPEEWAAYDVEMSEDGSVTAMITTLDGSEFEVVETGIDLDAWQDWDWVWDVWDWLTEWYPDVDKDSKYV